MNRTHPTLRAAAGTGSRTPRRRLSEMLAAVLVASVLASAPALAAGSDTVYAWGDNSEGQLGDGTSEGSATPQRVAMPKRITVKGVAAAHWHSLAVDDEGTVYGWGDESEGQIGTNPSGRMPLPIRLPGRARARQAAAGFIHSVALTDGGTVYAWGNDESGQLGDGDPGRWTSRPQPVPLPRRVRVRKLVVGAWHTLGATRNGTVYAWGSDSDGQLGDGTVSSPRTNAPQRVPLPRRVAEIAAGGVHSLALTEDGRVHAWGGDPQGQLGDGTAGDPTRTATPQPVDLPNGATIIALAAGYEHSLALAKNGTVYAWGRDENGQLGDGTPGGMSATPQRVRLPKRVRIVQIVAGERHNLALARGGAVYAWGSDGSGQLGDGTAGGVSATPQRVRLPKGVRVHQLAAGGSHSLASTR